MTLHHIVEAYIDYKHSLGMRFRSQAAVLRAFYRAMGDIAIAEVKPEFVLAFIAGTGPVTARWLENHRVLAGLLPLCSRPRICGNIPSASHGDSETPDLIDTVHLHG